ncbi:hypothetical protein ACH4ND_00945 [Streptomyces sp. NPDC017179]
MSAAAGGSDSTRSKSRTESMTQLIDLIIKLVTLIMLVAPWVTARL